MDIKLAKKIMGKNFIGPDELEKIAGKINIGIFYKIKIPEIKYKEKLLKKIAEDYILILGIPRNKSGEKLTINNMRSFFGFDPAKKEPCFYNQDWYLREKFAAEKSLKLGWYLIRKNVIKNTKGKNPEAIKSKFNKTENFPAAILTAYTFFIYYFHTKGQILWKNDFIWCQDQDANGDRIYTGRYEDPKKINKNGFNIHRHLKIRPVYGAVTQII